MPIYEYECNKCGRRFEFLQRLGDSPKKNCDCGRGGRLERLISAPAIRFKGSGWYVTDYAKKNGPSEDLSSKKPAKRDADTKAAGDSGTKDKGSAGDGSKTS